MTHKQIDASREVRLWITQVIIPAMGIVMMVPETREAVMTKARKVKQSIETAFTKK